MYCSKCGYKVDDDDTFCPSCGKLVKKIKNLSSTDEVTQQDNNVSNNVLQEQYVQEEDSCIDGNDEQTWYSDNVDEPKQEYDTYSDAAVQYDAYEKVKWYDRKRRYIPLILFTLISIVVTVVFLIIAVGKKKYSVIALLPIISGIFFVEYLFDGRLRRKVRYIIHIVENALVVIFYAVMLMWFCITQHNIISCVQNSNFMDTDVTIGEKFDDFFNDVDWYNVQALRDGGVLIEAKGSYKYGKDTRVVDIRFVYLGINMLEVNKNSELTWGTVKVDGNVIDRNGLYELFGIDEHSYDYSDVYETSDYYNQDDEKRFESDITLAQKSSCEFSNLTYEEAFDNIFSNYQWIAYDGISYAPDINNDGVADGSMERNDIVEFSGECSYRDFDATMVFQFIKLSSDKYTPVYLEINGVPQNKDTLDDIMDELMFPGKYSVYSNENSEYIETFPCGVFGNNYDSDAKVTIEYKGSNQYSVDIYIYRLASFDNLVGYGSNGGAELMVEGYDSAGNYISFYFPAITDDEMIFYVEKTSFPYLSEGDSFVVYMYR